MDGLPYRMANDIGTDVISSTFFNNLYDKTIKGDPSSHQIFLYAFADFLGLVFNIIPLTNKVLNHKGSSITLSSIKNCAKYFLTSFFSGLSGEPRLTNKTPFITMTLNISWVLSQIFF